MDSSAEGSLEQDEVVRRLSCAPLRLPEDPDVPRSCHVSQLTPVTHMGTISLNVWKTGLSLQSQNQISNNRLRLSENDFKTLEDLGPWSWKFITRETSNFPKNCLFLASPKVSDCKIIAAPPDRVCIYHPSCIGRCLSVFLTCLLSTFPPNTLPQYLARGVAENTSLQKDIF